MSALNCPVCRAYFNEVVRDGVLIDICSQCRGVWLDRGELEKLLETVRNDNQDFQMPRQAEMNDKNKNLYKYDRRFKYEDDEYDYENEKKGKYRKKSKIESFFDVFD